MCGNLGSTDGLRHRETRTTKNPIEMVNLENIGRIAEVIGVAIGSSWLTHILTVRSRVRKEKADAAKAETEVEADKIANLRKVIDDAYRPIIQDLKDEIADLKQKVEDQQVEMTEIKTKNEINDFQEIAIFKDGVTL